MKKITWDEIIKLEPRVNSLYEEAKRRQYYHPRHVRADKDFYNYFKPRLMSLVGWSTENQSALLKTEDAYDIVYRKIYDELHNKTTKPSTRLK